MNKNSRMNILINGVGGPTPRSVARSIHSSPHFKDHLIFGTDINPLAYGLYESDLYKRTFLIPRATDPLYWQSIEKIIAEQNIEYALVHPEHEVLEWSRRQENGQLPCKAIIPPARMVEVLTNKALMTEMLRETAWVPSSITIDPLDLKISAVEEALSYPFWIRSTSGSSGLGSLLIQNEQALRTWIHINKGVTEFIGSTYLPGRNLAVKLLYHNGKLLRSACGERVEYIMAKVAPSGITGNTSFGRLLTEPHLVDVAVEAMDILFEQTHSPKHGFYTVDLKEDDQGNPMITEINVRMVAFNWMFALAGANFTEDMLRILSEDPSYSYDYKMYEFEPGTIFLRDVDGVPKLMNERELLKS